MDKEDDKDGERQPPIGIKPPPDIYDEILKMGKKHDRKKAYIALKMALRGLALYRRDGLLEDPPGDSHGESGVVAPPSGEWIEVPKLRHYKKKPEKETRRA